jgi:hypothetical protein
VILAVVLAGAILLFFLILIASTVAILREAAPGAHGGHVSLLASIKRLIVHHFVHRR